MKLMAMQVIPWLLADTCAAIIAEIAETTSTNAMFHVCHPGLISWVDIMNHFSMALKVPTVPYQKWLANVLQGSSLPTRTRHPALVRQAPSISLTKSQVLDPESNGIAILLDIDDNLKHCASPRPLAPADRCGGRVGVRRVLEGILRGKVKDMSFKYDASHITHIAVEYSGLKEQNEISEELKSRYRDLARSKYSKVYAYLLIFLILPFLSLRVGIQFSATKLIRFCPTYRAASLRGLQGHALRLLLHWEASGVRADAFKLYTTAYERSILIHDFYGTETSVSRGHGG